MKFLTVAGLFGLAFNLYAGPIDEAVREIEIERNAQCREYSRSTFSKCIGSPKTCYYSIKYRCFSNDSDFRVKVKVRENISGVKVRLKIID